MSRPPIRRTGSTRDVAEAAFKSVTAKPVAPLPKPPSIPNAKEAVSLRIDRDILDFFQDGGPGWQDRINEALRQVVVQRGGGTIDAEDLNASNDD